MVKHLILILTAASIVLTGCAKPKPQPEEEKPSPEALLQNEVDKLMESGDAAGALALLDDSLKKETFETQKPDLFRLILSILMNDQQIQEAVTRHIAMASESPEVAEYSCQMMEQSLIQLGDKTLLLDWSTALLTASFSDTTKARMYITNANALIANDREEEALALIPKCRNEMNSSMCLNIYRGIIDSQLANGRQDLAEAAISKVGELSENTPELLELVTVSRLNLLSLQEKWDAFLDLYKTALPALPDRTVATLLNTAASRMKAGDKPDLLSKACAMIIDARKADESCFYSAARHWLDIGIEAEPDKIPLQFRTLLDKGMPSDKLIRITSKPYYALLQGEKFSQLKDMMAIVKEMKPNLTDERDIESAKSMLLDGSFVLNDYDTAIAMVTDGIVGKSESWHKSAIVKLRAHKALDAGQTEEAIRYFREFMSIISESMDRETDPTTGLTYTAKWCLGRNARRIGDLYKNAGDSSSAAAAYKEAGQHFKAALEDFPADSRETVALKEEMAQLPATD